VKISGIWVSDNYIQSLALKYPPSITWKTNDLADTGIKKKGKIVLSSGYRQCYLALSFLSAVHLITHQTICAVYTEPLFSSLSFYSASKLHTYKKKNNNNTAAWRQLGFNVGDDEWEKADFLAAGSLGEDSWLTFDVGS